MKSGERMEVRIEGLAKGIECQVWISGRERQGVCCLAAFYRGRASPAELRSGPSQWHTGGGRRRSVQTKVRRVIRMRVRVGEEN